mmetsp:Transcript_65247/g.143001  ORF Transcript_65247/g.143001 Transcript_65247/m.143001 type:complete len:217 (+) Transcript_65247:76-726(+)
MHLFGFKRSHLLCTLEVSTKEWVGLLLCGLVSAGGIGNAFQFLGDFLVGFAEDGTKIASMCLLILCSFGVGAEKANGKAFFSSSASTADSMCILLNGKRKSIIDHELHILDVETSASDIRGNQRCLLGGFEVCECLRSLVLRHVPLQCNDFLVAFFPQKSLQPGNLLLVQSKNDHLFIRTEMLLEIVQQTRWLVLFVLDDLHDLSDCRVGHKTFFH